MPPIVRTIIWAAALGLIVLFGSRFAGSAASKINL